jgi:cell division septum initiation protein DivIVA
MSFPMSRRGRRGLDEDHVRAFLREVEAELVALLNEKTSLWNEVERLRRRIIAGKNAAGQAVLFGKEDAHVHAVAILSSAQLTADRYVADAQAYSQRITEEARSRRDQILTQAQQHADLVLEEATARAREAALQALNAPAPDSPHLQASRSALQAELAYLRAFGEVYRTHLRAYTEGMLRSIDEWERKEAASFQEVTQGGPMAAAPVFDGSSYHR